MWSRVYYWWVQNRTSLSGHIPTGSDFVEIVSIELPNEYQKDSWQLDDNEKTNAIKVMREEGNELYKKGDTEAAEDKYRRAIGMIEQLLMK